MNIINCEFKMDAMREEVVNSTYDRIRLPRRFEFIKSIELIGIEEAELMASGNCLLPIKGKVEFECPFPNLLIFFQEVYLLFRRPVEASAKIIYDVYSVCDVTRENIDKMMRKEMWIQIRPKWAHCVSGGMIWGSRLYPKYCYKVGVYDGNVLFVYKTQNPRATCSYIIRDGVTRIGRRMVQMADIKKVLYTANFSRMLVGIGFDDMPLFHVKRGKFKFDMLANVWEKHSGKKTPIFDVSYNGLFKTVLRLHPDGERLIGLSKVFGVYHVGRGVFIGFWKDMWHSFQGLEVSLAKRFVEVFRGYLGFMKLSDDKVYYKSPFELRYQGVVCKMHEAEEKNYTIPEGEYSVLLWG